QLLGREFNLHLTHADFGREGVSAAVTALGRISEAKQKALVSARERLQAQVPTGRKRQWRASKVADGIGVGDLIALDQPFAIEQLRHLRRWITGGLDRPMLRWWCGQRRGRVEQAM